MALAQHVRAQRLNTAHTVSLVGVSMAFATEMLTALVIVLRARTRGEVVNVIGR